MRVLILADECNPEWPSLPIVGYKAAKAIAEYADTTVVTQIRNKENIDAVGLGKAKVDYVDSEYIARPVYRLLESLRGNEGSWTTVMAFNYPNYLAFEMGVWKKYKERIRNGEFDVIHRVTPMSPTQASFIAKRSPVPFVLGPLNGGLKWPKQFLKEMQREREWLSALRGAFKWLPYSRSTFSKSAAILASFEHTIEQVPAHAHDKTIDFPEVGIDPELFNSPRARPERDQKSILFAGRLVPYKLPEFVVQAFADSSVLQQHRLIIAGDGPCRVEMEQIVKQHGLEEIVQFVGWKTQAEIGRASCRERV
jgi:glycosyltransferase involved in cell wall biosynthesis